MVWEAEQDLQVKIPCLAFVKHFTDTDFSALHSKHLKLVSSLVLIFLTGFLFADFRFAIQNSKF